MPCAPYSMFSLTRTANASTVKTLVLPLFSGVCNGNTQCVGYSPHLLSPPRRYLPPRYHRVAPWAHLSATRAETLIAEAAPQTFHSAFGDGDYLSAAAKGLYSGAYIRLSHFSSGNPQRRDGAGLASVR